MQPLTQREWGQHFVQLREHIEAVWPQVEEFELSRINGDWDALVALIQDASGQSEDVIVDRLRRIDVQELGLAGGKPTEVDLDDGDEGQPDDTLVGVRASLEQALRLGDGFTDGERAKVIERLAKLDRRLSRFPADGTDLYLTSKDRDTNSQKISLECRVPGFAMFVATSNESDFMAALADVRDDLLRQLDQAVTRRREAVR